jgi:hypothetical protein
VILVTYKSDNEIAIICKPLAEEITIESCYTIFGQRFKLLLTCVRESEYPLASTYSRKAPVTLSSPSACAHPLAWLLLHIFSLSLQSPLLLKSVAKLLICLHSDKGTGILL